MDHIELPRERHVKESIFLASYRLKRYLIV